jgi:hypothetical protein
MLTTIPTLPERRFIRIGLSWRNAENTMAALNEQCVIYRDGGDLFELIGTVDRNQQFNGFVLRKITPRRLQILMGRAADFAKLDKRSQTWHRCDPPTKLAQQIMEAVELWPFTQIRPIGYDAGEAT